MVWREDFLGLALGIIVSGHAFPQAVLQYFPVWGQSTWCNSPSILTCNSSCNSGQFQSISLRAVRTFTPPRFSEASLKLACYNSTSLSCVGEKRRKYGRDSSVVLNKEWKSLKYLLLHCSWREVLLPSVI